MTASYTFTKYKAIDDGILPAAWLWSDRIDAECELLAATLFDPAPGFAAAVAAGVRAAMFAAGLNQTTWLALGAKAYCGRWSVDPRPRIGAAHPDAANIVRLVAGQMRADGVWRDEHAIELAELALSHFVRSTVDVPSAARRLVDAAGRLAELAAIEARRREIFHEAGRRLGAA